MFKLILAGVDRFFTISLKKSQVRSGIAIVKLDAIGDFIIWLDTAKEYRFLYPENKITLIVNSLYADLARKFPYWDNVWPIELRRFTHDMFYRWAMLRKIKKASFAIALQPTFSRTFLHGDSIIRATQAPLRIGSKGDLSCISAFHKTVADRWYTRLISAEQRPLMELERNAEFISNLSGQKHCAKLPVLPVLTKLPERITPPKEYFIIVPGASCPSRQWPVALFSAVAEQLQRQHGWLLVLCGSLAEEPLCRSVAEGSKTVFMNLAGKTTLPEFAEVIRGAKCLICNETSAIHFATAVGTP